MVSKTNNPPAPEGKTVADKAAEDKAAADKAAEDKAAADKAAEDKAAASRPNFVLCAGKALTTKRGIISEGGGISADDLIGGSDSLKAFIKSGHIEKG